MDRKKKDSPTHHKVYAAEQAVQAERVAAATARYEALAREHGADLSEEGFNEALKKVGKAKV